MSEHHQSSPSRRYTKLTKESAYPLIERYFSSGDLPSTFYRREGLTEHQFYKWRKYYLADHPSLASRLDLAVSDRRTRKVSRRGVTGHPADEGGGFGRLVASGVSPTCGGRSSSAEHWEIEYPNGVRLRIGVRTPLDVVGALVSVSGI